MKRRAFCTAFILILSFPLTAQRKYEDVFRFMGEMNRIQSGYLAALKSARGSAQVASAIRKFGDDVARIMPQIKKLEEKYPELKDDKKIPADLKPVLEESMRLSRELADVSLKIMHEYRNDKEVMKAVEEMSRKLSGGEPEPKSPEEDK